MNKTKRYTSPIRRCERSAAILVALALVVSFTLVTAVPVAAADAPVWHTSDQETASGTTIAGSVAAPGNLEEGDLVILIIAKQNSFPSDDAGTTTPEGFTRIRYEHSTAGGGRPEVLAFWKIATASEPLTYDFTVLHSDPQLPNWRAIAARVTGHDPANPIGSNSGNNTALDEVISLQVPQVTTIRNNVLLVGAVATRGVSSNHEEPGTMDALWQENGTSADWNGDPGVCVGAEVFAMQGDTGTRTFAWTGDSRAAGLMFEILPLIEYELTVISDGCCPISVEWNDTCENVTAGGSGNFTIADDTWVTLIADDSDPCCEFVEWTVDVLQPRTVLGNNFVEDPGQITILMDGDKTVTAVCTSVCGSIGDTIFYDYDGNGIKDPGEPGISGVTVELYKDDGDGEFNPEWMGGSTDELVDSTSTDAEGNYLFSNVPPFCDEGYWVFVVEGTLPPGVTLTTGSNPIGPICLEAGQEYQAADFGYQPSELPPVGGTAYPVNRMALLALWIGLGAAVVAGATICVRRRRAQS